LTTIKGNAVHHRDSIRMVLAPLCLVAVGFAAPDPKTPTRASSGFVVNADGYLLTSAHGVKDAGKIEVTLGSKTYEATLVRLDEKHDLAILRIDAKELPSLPLADSDAVELGEDVRVFGFPLSLCVVSLSVAFATAFGSPTLLHFIPSFRPCCGAGVPQCGRRFAPTQEASGLAWSGEALRVVPPRLSPD
jgi:hypothetical protein